MVVGDAMGLRGPEGMCSPNRAKNRLFLRATSSLETEVNSSALCHISMRVCVCQWPWVSTSLQEPRSTTPRGSARTPQLSVHCHLPPGLSRGQVQGEASREDRA